MILPAHALLLATTLIAGQGPAPAPTQDPRPEKRIGVKTGVPGALVFETPAQVLAEDTHQGATLERRFTFKNGGASTVHIEQGIALSAGGAVEFSPARVPPGANGEVRVRQPVGDRLGRRAFRFALVTDEPGVARYRLGLTGFVESAYDPETPRLDLGVVDEGAVRSAEVELFSREVEALQVLEVLDAPPFLRVDATRRAGLGAEGVRLRASFDTRQAPLGVTRGTLRLRTNVPTQPECDVSYSLNVVGDVVPSKDTLSLGLVRLGEEATAELTLVSRSGRAVEVTGTEDSEARLTTEVLPCPADKASPACRVLRVKHPALERGHFSGKLSIRVAGLEGPLRVVYSGLVISPGTRIKEIDLTQAAEIDADAAPMSKQTMASPVPASPQTQPALTPGPASQGVTLEWRARNESSVYGYLVYRSDKPSGPFLRVSRKIVQAAGGDGEIRSYSFLDKDVQPERRYYYYLDVVDTGGLKQRLTGVKAREVGPGQ